VRDLLLLHAFPLDARQWAPQRADLAAAAALHTPDLPGFGASSDPPLRSLDDLARALHARTRTMDRFVLGGLSMGGYVALAYLRLFGTGRLAGLILADTRADPDTDAARCARDESIALVRSEGGSALADRQLPRMFAGPLDSAPARAASDLMRAQRPDTVVAALEALRDRPDARPQLAALAVPALVLCGAADAVTPPGEMRKLSDLLPNSRFVLLPEAGHLSNLEAPAAFSAAVRDFLRSL
jgi:pimeloyl-ACP methyl ester carboxylesterase